MKALVIISSGYDYLTCVAAAVVEGLAREGHEVLVLVCDGRLHGCSCHPYRAINTCAACQLYTSKVLTGLRVPFQHAYLPPTRATTRAWTFASVAELKNFTHEGVNFGMSVASMLIDKLRHDDFDTRAHAQTINGLLADAMDMYAGTRALLGTLAPDKVYIYNGRFPAEAGILAACCSLGVPFATYDTMGFGKQGVVRYAFAENTEITSISEYGRHCEEHYARLDKEQARQAALDWVQRRAAHKVDNVFTQRQTMGNLPENFSSKRKNISYFSSSSFEFSAVPGFKRIFGPYASEADMLARLCESLLPHANIHLYVRVHPNIVRDRNEKKKRQLAAVGEIYPNISVLSPDSAVDTYELIRHSDTIIVSVSSVGFESALLGKSVIVLGDSLYKGLGGFYTPETHEEIVALLLRDLPPQEPIGAIKIANYWLSGGLAAPIIPISLAPMEHLLACLRMVRSPRDVIQLGQRFLARARAAVCGV